MKVSSLTKKQKAVLDFIKSFQKEKGYPPTFEEIGKKFKLSSVGTVYQYINALQKKGHIQRKKGHARSIELYGNNGSDLIEIPLMGVITAGVPIEAIRNPEPIEVPKSMLSRTGRHYALKVRGDSMIDEGIFNGDTVIVREQLDVNNGESAIVYLPDTNEATLKKFYKEKNRFRLQPANPKLDPKYYKDDELEIQGKVVSVIRNF